MESLNIEPRRARQTQDAKTRPIAKPQMIITNDELNARVDAQVYLKVSWPA
jgi:regulator of protease activity HflC (stomatin/prohibitin superfamily)